MSGFLANYLHRQRKECAKKWAFPTWARASAQAEFDTLYHGTKHFVYRCHVCDQLHMTTCSNGPDIVDASPHIEGRVLFERRFKTLEEQRAIRIERRALARRRSKESLWPTWMIRILIWFHETMVGLENGARAEAHMRYAAKQRRELAARVADVTVVVVNP